jgi:hypothetical protein
MAVQVMNQSGRPRLAFVFPGQVMPDADELVGGSMATSTNRK